jgi:outer membrane protein assembly factor BamD (BamD/ComL family)
VRKVFALIILIALAGCASLRAPSKATTGPEEDYQNAARCVQEKKYQSAIKGFKKVANDSPQSQMAADALFEAAYLQAYYDNPQKDFALALQGFDDFLKRYPQHARAQEAQSWRFVLKTILDTKKENERLNRSIEELKKLDIRHEQRRRK